MALLDYSYPELSSDALNTPAQDWRILFEYMLTKNLHTIFDAGAGNAISAQVAEAEYPNIYVHAWELVNERIQNVKCKNQDVRCADLFTEEIPKTDITFIYLPTGPLLERVLSQLTEGALIAAVESHGELFDRLSECAQCIDELDITAKRHHPKLRIYKMQKPIADLKHQLRQLSFNDCYTQIMVRETDPFEGDSIWIADCFGATVTSDGYVESLFPPRRFLLSQVVEIREFDKKNYLIERRSGKWRKIIIEPRMLLETPDGKRIVAHGEKSSLG